MLFGFNKIILILLLIFIPSSCFSQPFFITEDNIWDENTKIYISGCDKHKEGDKDKQGNKNKAENNIKQNTIKQCIYFPDFLDMIIVKIKLNSYIFAVSSGNEQKPSILYCYKLSNPQQNTNYNLHNTDNSLQNTHFAFPRSFSKAKLSAAKVNISGKQKQYLSIIANGDYVTLFDITDPESLLKPIFSIPESGLQGSMKQICEGRFIKMEKSQVFIFGGLEIMGTLHIVDLNNLSKIQVFRTHKKNAFTYLKALDTQQTGIADQLLLCDEANHLWRFNLLDTNAGFQLLSDKMYARDFIAAKNLKQPGISLYYLDKGMLNRLNIAKVMDKEPEVLKNAGENFHHIFIRSARLILVPKLIFPKQLPCIFDLAQEKRMQTSWVFSLISETIGNEIIQSKLLWDPKNQQEVLMTMNQKGDINILSATVTRDKLGRQVWCSCQN